MGNIITKHKQNDKQHNCTTHTLGARGQPKGEKDYRALRVPLLVHLSERGILRNEPCKVRTANRQFSQDLIPQSVTARAIS